MSTMNGTHLIAIVGGSGSGKTWMADRLQDLLGDEAGRLSLDHFYRDRSHLSAARRARLNFDHPDAIEWARFDQVLASLSRGVPTPFPQYDFATHCRREDLPAEAPRPITLVDGLWLLHRPAIRRRFDFSIFLDCSADERLRRRLVRDVAERGRDATSVRRQFLATVAPMHDRTVAPQRRHAHLVIAQPCGESEIRRLYAQIRFLQVNGHSAETAERPVAESSSASLFLTPSLS